MNASEVGVLNLFAKYILFLRLVNVRIKCLCFFPEADRYIQTLRHGSGRLDSGVIRTVSFHGLQHRITLSFCKQQRDVRRKDGKCQIPLTKWNTDAVDAVLPLDFV